MLRWVPYSLIRITLFYIAGIALAVYQGNLVSRTESIFVTLFFATVFIVLGIILRRTNFLRFNLFLSIIGFLGIFSFGFLSIKLSDQSLNSDHVIHKKRLKAYEAEVIEPAYSTEKTNRYLVEIKSSLVYSNWQHTSGLVYLYMDKKHQNRYHYGDKLIVADHPKLLSKPQNPGEFDYKRFLSFKNIFHQQYSKGENVQSIKSDERYSLMKRMLRIRQWAVNLIKTNVENEREQNIALALILGVKDGLSDDIKNAYSASGAMHVLAVSGLHVGIIYAIVLLIFGRLQKVKNASWLLGTISLVVLWSYAAITGFSPSVLRAVTMFSFVAIAKASGRSTNIYNTLAASAFTLLIFDPYLIMSVGFQLSYLAVLGIVYLQPKIYAQFIFNNYLVDKVWTITSVSIAAQLATFSLGMLYFHQFPTFFLLSNLVVIPGAFLILLGGLLLLLFNFWTPIASLIGYLLNELIFWINEIVFIIEKLPRSLISNIYITTPQTWLILGGLLSLVLLFQHRKKYYLYSAFGCTVIFSLIQWNRAYDNSLLDKVTIYKVNHHTAIDLISSGKSKLITDSILWNDLDKKRFHIWPNELRSGISSFVHEPFRIKSGSLNSFKWNNEKFTVLKTPLNNYSLDKSVKTNYLVVADGFKGSLETVTKNFQFDLLVVDGSLSNYWADRIKNEAVELNINFYSVYHDGALDIKI